MSSFRFSFLTFRSLSARLTFWVMLTVMIVTVIIALIVSYISSSAVLMGTKENVQSRMEIANQHINSVLVGVEVAVANNIPEVENSLSNPDKMYGVVRRLLELNPNIIGSTVAFEPDFYPQKGKQFSPYAYRGADESKLEQMNNAKKAPESKPVLPDVSIDEFAKCDMRVCKVLTCEAVKKSEKLLKFTLDDGSGKPRQILSGIHKFYEPEQLIGKTVVAILNLPPRKMMGQESNGMLLSALREVDGKEELHLLMLDDSVPAGAQLC